MAALAFLYGFCGVCAALCLAYALTDPTDHQPSGWDAAYVVSSAVFWPAWVLLLVVGLSLDAVRDRRRHAYYGGGK